jgi:hypothetical protein
VSTERKAADLKSASHLRDLDERHSVLAGIERSEDARTRIQETFGDRLDMVIIYQGVAAGLSQAEIIAELAKRGLPGASKGSVYRSIQELERLWFIRKPKKGRHVVRPAWDEEFNLTRDLKRILRRHRVTPL